MFHHFMLVFFLVKFALKEQFSPLKFTHLWEQQSRHLSVIFCL